mmetsp:Transcript_109633/g.291181  ORF Transcript_109633/g.291181 Transcript_109633/m.291181 type:complete len:205 (+) Transcript_109633:100-714(+)
MLRSAVVLHLAPQPIHELAVLPGAIPLQPLVRARNGRAMLLALVPLPAVGPAVRPSEGALAVLLPFVEVALVDPPVRPPHLASRRHGIPSPLPSVPSAIVPGVHTLSVHVVAVKLAFVLAEARPLEATASMLLTGTEATLKHRAISPALFALSLLQIIGPLPGVRRPRRVVVHTVAMFHISVKLAHILRTVRQRESAFPVFLRA